MLYLKERKGFDPLPSLTPASAPSGEVKVQEDDVDKLLAGVDGRVHRKKDPQM